MISPHTPPGTRIICIDADDNGQYETDDTDYRGVGLDGLRLGDVYTVHLVDEDPGSTSGFCVILCEIIRQPKQLRFGFALERFRRLDLPKCLRDIEAGRPIERGAYEEPNRRYRTLVRRLIHLRGVDTLKMPPGLSDR
jgi:hypothetical protein